MTSLTWPPRTRDEMLAWQSKYGMDREIAQAANTSFSAVRRSREKFRVNPLGSSRAEVTRPRAFMSDSAMADIYDDRTYDDAGEIRL